MRRKTKYQVYVVSDYDCFGDGRDQLIATFENVDEDFMDEVCHFIPDIRDVKCRWQEAPQDTKEQNGHNAQQPQERHYCLAGCGEEVPFAGALCGIMTCEHAI